MNIAGNAKEYTSNYVPAYLALMYDGYYIYSKQEEPVNIISSSGSQLFLDENNEIVDSNLDGNAIPIYEPSENSRGISGSYSDKNFEYVTDVTKAKKEYKNILDNKKDYAAHYVKSSTDTDVVVRFTLDNRIYVYGNVGKNKVGTGGNLVWFDKQNSQMPTINSSLQTVAGTIYNGINIEAEELSEQLIFYNNETQKYCIGNFSYVYDCNHQKLYYDNSEMNFFVISGEKKERVFLNEDVAVGDEGCYYKSLSLMWENDKDSYEYKKIYQVINGIDKGKWYIAKGNDPQSPFKKSRNEDLDQVLDGGEISNLNISENITADYSAISYYVEAYAFTNWVNKYLSGANQKIYNNENKQYEIIEINDVFSITEKNNPDDNNSEFVNYKKRIMKEIVLDDLDAAILNYSRGVKKFSLPIPTEKDWDKAFNDITILTFLQGIPIGAKNYNNYYLATSRSNCMFVNPDSFNFSGDDEYFHRLYCADCNEESIYTGYREIEYTVREVKTEDGSLFFYMHDYPEIEQNDENDYSEKACYNCVVNRANYKKIENNAMKKSYNEALARERYKSKAILTVSSSTPSEDGKGLKSKDIKWKADFYWKDTYYTEPFKKDSTSFENDKPPQTEAGPFYRDRVSAINIATDDEEGSVIQMMGNENRRGKGAIWGDVKNGDLKSISFSFTVNPGDSFVDAGVIFNVHEYNDKLTFYYLAKNYQYDTLYRAANCTASDYPTERYSTPSRNPVTGKTLQVDLYQLKEFDPTLQDEFAEEDPVTGEIKVPWDMWGVNKLTDSCKRRLNSDDARLVLYKVEEYKLDNNYIPVEKIKVVKILGNPSVDSATGIRIIVVDDGYMIYTMGTSFHLDVPASEKKSNVFGFMSNHHLHNCWEYGDCTIENIKLVIEEYEDYDIY